MRFKTALIVDDSKLARVTLKKKLETHGLQVQTADSASQAFECLSSYNPEIIFMDHLMPETDGFEATQHIRQIPGFEHTPIVMCTGKEHDGYLEEALAIGANFILSKPPVDEALAAILFADSAQAVTKDVVVMPEYTVTETPLESDVPVMHVSPVSDAADSIMTGVGREVTDDYVPKAMESFITDDDVRRICFEIINSERVGIIADAITHMPQPELPEIPPPLIDMDSIISTVNASVSHQLAVNASTLKAELRQDIESTITQMLDRDIQGILDLRLNVMLTERFAKTEQKLESLAQSLNSQQSRADIPSDAPVILQQPSALNTRIEELFEEQVQLKSRLKMFQFTTVAAFLLAAAAIALSIV